jgi:hypothetical protein
MKTTGEGTEKNEGQMIEKKLKIPVPKINQKFLYKSVLYKRTKENFEEILRYKAANSESLPQQ